MNKFGTKQKGNNKGFSLIEVLCAIVLLGLIAAPFLQMVYSSYATNQKSKKMLAASDLCQTILEGLSSQTYEDSKTFDSSTVINGVGKYYFPASGEGSKLGNRGLYPASYNSAGVPASNVPIPQGNLCSNPDGDRCLGDRDKTAYFRDVSYGGYIFNVTITAKEKSPFPTNPVYPSGSKKFFSIPIEIKVYEGKEGVAFHSGTLNQFTLLQTASTKIPNKR